MTQQKTAYRFNSKHLGKAFMDELEEMGCKVDGEFNWHSGYVNFGNCKQEMIYHEEGKISVHNHQVTYDAKTFQLESEYAEALEHARKQLEPGFKVGDWVIKKDHEKCLLLINKKGYEFSGFDVDGKWDDNRWYGSKNHWNSNKDGYRKATKEEIEKALIQEKDRRGFKKGVTVKDLSDTGVEKITSDKFQYDYEYDELFVSSDSMYMGKAIIYSKSRWAEIIEDTIEVNGYEAEFCDGYVKFGCAEIENSIFIELQKFFDEENPFCKGIGNRALTSVKIGEGEFDRETIQKIVDRL